MNSARRASRRRTVTVNVSKMPLTLRRNSWAAVRAAVRVALQVLVVLTIAAAVASPASIFGKKKKHKPQGPPPDLPGHVEYLAKQLYGLHLDESDALTSQIQKLVLDHMSEWLVQHPPSDKPTFVPYHVDVRRELENVFSKIQPPIYAWPSTFGEKWKESLLIGVGYTLGWSKYDRANVVALYESREGKVHPVAVTNFVPRVDLHYEFLPPPASGDFWLLVYGTRLGKSHPRLSAELYDFDGQTLKSLWKTEDVYDGKMEFQNDRVVISYMREKEFIEATTYGRTPPRREAVYRITGQGLELVTDHQISSRGQ